MSRIEVSNVSKLYGPVKAVTEVSFTVAQGEFVTLLGPSGSGKTTTMRMIAGLEKPNGGTVSIGDRIVSSESVWVPTHRRSLGMVFQSYAVWPHKTVLDNVAFPLAQRNVDGTEQKRRVRRVLDLVELGAFADRYPSQLSGGQQQRVALARALVAEPAVILFDEPLSNLDAQLRDAMRGLLALLHRELRITSVYVTHDQGEAMVLSDRVHVMDKGRLMQAGTPVEIYEHPTSLFVASFIGQANCLRIASIDRAAGRATLQGGDVIAVAGIPDEIRENAVIVRPHQLTFAAEGDTANVLQGVVRAAFYLGDRARFEVRTDAADLTVELLAEQPRPNVGETVRVKLPSHRCMVL